MKYPSIRFAPIVAALLGTSVLFTAFSASGGFISKPLIFLFKQGGKKLLKQGAKDLTKEAAEKEARYLIRKFGSEAAAKVEETSLKHGIPKERVLTELRRYGQIYKRAGFSDEADRVHFSGPVHELVLGHG